MSRYRPPGRRWHVDDHCMVPWYHRGRLRGWTHARVVAVRRDRVVVRQYRWESVHPWWEVMPPFKARKHCRFSAHARRPR